jgi:hypothetical protein
VFVGSNPTLSASFKREPPIMVIRIGYSATTSREPRQARKGAAAAMMSGAGARLVRIASIGSKGS